MLGQVPEQWANESNEPDRDCKNVPRRNEDRTETSIDSFTDPMHVSPDSGVRIVLIEHVIITVVKHRTIRIVQPVLNRHQMELRTERIDGIRLEQKRDEDDDNEEFRDHRPTKICRSDIFLSFAFYRFYQSVFATRRSVNN